MENEPAGGRFYRFLTSPLLIAGLVFLLLWFVGRIPDIAIDEGLWNYIANLWVRYGVPPYVGAVENKSPGIFEIFALSNILFGINYWFPRLLGIISMAATALMICYLGRALHGRTAGAFAGLIFGLTMTWSRIEGYWPAQTESFMVFFVVVSFLLILTGVRKSGWGRMFLLLASGFSAGTAIQFKQVAIFSAVAMLVFMLLEGRTSLRDRFLRWGGIFVIGLLAGILIVLIPLFLSGVTLWDYIDGAWLILFQGGTAAPLSIRLVRFYRLWFRSEMVLFWPLVFLFFAQHRKLRDAGVPLGGFVIWMILDFAGANASGYYYGHQLKQFVPPVALAGGFGIAQLFRSLQLSNAIPANKFPSRVLLSLVVLAVVMCAFSPFRISPEPRAEVPKLLGFWLRDNTSRDDYIYVNTLAGDAWAILAYADRRCPSRYFTYMFLSREGAMEEFERDIRTRKPKFIVDRPDDPWMNIPWFGGFLDSNYVLIKTEGNFRVFQLK